MSGPTPRKSLLNAPSAHDASPVEISSCATSRSSIRRRRPRPGHGIAERAPVALRLAGAAFGRTVLQEVPVLPLLPGYREQ